MKKLLQLYILLLTCITYSQQLEFEVFNTSINSKYAELGVTYFGTDNALFASSKKTENDKSFVADRRRNNRQLFVDLYISNINSEGDLVGSKKFTNEINNKFYVSDITFSSDLKTTFFTWNNFYNTTSRKDSAKWQTLHIVKADINPDFEISHITDLPFNSEEYTIKSPELSKDGKKLYFVSDMPNGYGKSDIYVVDINNDGTYSEPRNLGPNVNSPYSEEFPHVDASNTIYFSSYGHNSKGGYDIFRSQFKNGEYQKTEQLPDPINTKKDDFAFVIDTNSNTGFFTSTRKGGEGDADIYGFKMVEKEIECTQLITGLIVDKKSKKNVSDAIISIFENEELLKTLTTNKTGNYSFDLKCNANYKITAEKEHFIASEIELETDETIAFEISQNIELTPIDCVQLVGGVVSNKLTNDLLEDITVKLYENGEIITTKSTLNDGSYNFDLKCSTNYLIIAVKVGFNPSEIKINTNGSYETELTKNIELIPLECNQLLAGRVSNKETGEQLINVAINLYKNNSLIKTEKLSNDGKFRLELSCDETYTIIAEKEGFHNSEIEILTTNDRDLNIETNIELSPIICNQLISGVITNKTTNEALTQVTLNLFENNNLIDSQEVESRNDYNFKVDCSSNYKIVAIKEGFLNTEIELKTDTRNDFNQVKNIELIPLECNQLLAGTVSNKETGEQLINVAVYLYKNNSLIKTEKLSGDGKFRLELNCDETYRIIAEKEGFQNSVLEILTTNERDLNFETTIELSPIICNQLITGVITNKTTNKALTQVTLNLFENNNLIDSQEVESSNDYSFKVECSSNYKIIAIKEGFKNSEIELKTDTRNDFNQVKNIELIPLECNQLLSGTVSNKETGEQLINVAVYLYKNNSLLKTEKLSNDGKFRLELSCEESYKIIAGKEGFQNSEIEIITTNERNLNFETTIELSPIICNQLISGVITNKTTNEALTQVTLNLFENNNLIDSQEVESSNNYNFKVDCSSNYKIVAIKEGFVNAEIELKTDIRNDFNQVKNIELIPLECNQVITGVIVDENTKERLNNLDISLFQNNVLKETITLRNLEFKFDVDCNESYKIVVNKTNYLDAELELSTNSIHNASISKTILLTPLKCTQIVSGKILDRNTSLPIPNAIISIYSNQLILETIKLDENANFNFELDCKLQYEIVASSANYQNNVWNVNPTNNYNEEFNKTIYLTPVEEFEIVRNQKMIKTNPIYFDLDKAEITPLAILELEKVVSILLRNPALKIEVKSHTDSRAPDNYNLNLSNRRAQSVVDYIISKGIDSSRLASIGLGETKLINKCSNGVKCTEAEHQLNRRTEFVIIEN
ncbi:OmpA family protein [Lutibacter flavus]|uniref:Outer membrane protein OmpA n=1 Tax=Lutibacter flavus TaxID=691689 RepID=A0A238VC40_9FLAO|nr:OmpA family protein [Lutibacter flavus]SNR31962.1 Outer membrane protein OmpA [Lutibacter flavus]